MTYAYQIKAASYESDMKSRAVNVLSYLCDRANKELTCFPSLKTIARCLHISLSTVKRAISELVEKGFLKKDPRFTEKKNGAQTSNLYTLSIPQKEIVCETLEGNTQRDVTTEEVDSVDVRPLIPCEPEEHQVTHLTFEDMVAQWKVEETEEETVYPQEIADEMEEEEIYYPMESITSYMDVPYDLTRPIAVLPLSSLAPPPRHVAMEVEKVVVSAPPECANSTDIPNYTAPWLPKDIDRYLEDSTIRSCSDLAYELEWDEQHLIP